MIRYWKRLTTAWTLYRLSLKIKRLLYFQEQIMADLTALNAAVAANTAAVQAVAAAFASAANADQAGVDAAVTQINVNNDALKSLVTPAST